MCLRRKDREAMKMSLKSYLYGDVFKEYLYGDVEL